MHMQVVRTSPEHEAVCKMMQGGTTGVPWPTTTVQLLGICRSGCSLCWRAIINLNGYTKVYNLIQDMTRMPIHGIMAGDLFGYHENLNQMLDAGDESDNGHLCDDASPLKSV